MERVEIYGHYRQADRRARQVPAGPIESSPPRACQRLYAAHTKCAAHAEPSIDSRHTHAKCAACAEPSRQDRRHAADSTPAIGKPSQIRGPT